MSKLTVVTDSFGRIQVIAHGHLSQASVGKEGKKGPQGGIAPRPGQVLREIDLPEDVSRVKNWDDLREKVMAHVKAR